MKELVARTGVAGVKNVVVFGKGGLSENEEWITYSGRSTRACGWLRRS